MIAHRRNNGDLRRGGQELGKILALSLVGLGAACGTAEPEQSVAPTPTATRNSPVAPSGGPPAPPSNALIARLSPRQTQQLKALGVPLVVPTQVPSGFSLVQVEVQGDRPAPEAAGSRAYTLLYRDTRDRCFVVEFQESEPSQSPATEYRLPIHAPLFAEQEVGLNYGRFVNPELRSQVPDPALFTDWLSSRAGVYRLAGAGYINDALTPEQPCQDIEPETAVRITESLTILTDEIMGDG